MNGKDPGRVALLFLREEVTYGQLQRRVEQVAALVLELGGQKGDRVVLIDDNSFFWVAAYLGIMRAGLVCVPLSPGLSIDELEYVLKTTGARMVFAQAGIAIRFGAALRNVHLVTSTVFASIEAGSPSLRPSPGDSGPPLTESSFPSTERDDLAALMFTSGSTGRPRGVMITHGNIIANTESIIECLQLTDRDRIMTVLPFHSCFGTSLLHTHLRAGGSLVVDSRFMYREVVLQRMIDTECTGFAGVPSHFQILLRNSSLSAKKFPALRYVQQAGGRLAPSFIGQLRAAVSPADVYIMYGQTEATARLSCLPPDFLETKLGSIGKGIPGIHLRVVNESGNDVRPGEIGEIVARGDSVARGYWGAPDESARSFRNGLLYTGDLATVDKDGFIFVVDRARDFLKCAGRRVSCRQLEEELLACDELLEAAVVGIPDDILGEGVKAFIVPRGSDSWGVKERVSLFCKSRFSPEFVPREIVVLPTLPKNGAGKVLKANLRAS